MLCTMMHIQKTNKSVRQNMGSSLAALEADERWRAYQEEIKSRPRKQSLKVAATIAEKAKRVAKVRAKREADKAELKDRRKLTFKQHMTLADKVTKGGRRMTCVMDHTGVILMESGRAKK